GPGGPRDVWTCPRVKEGQSRRRERAPYGDRHLNKFGRPFSAVTPRAFSATMDFSWSAAGSAQKPAYAGSGGHRTGEGTGVFLPGSPMPFSGPCGPDTS